MKFSRLFTGREVSIYPTGDKKNGGQDHISVFLRLLDTNSLPAGWEVNAIFTFFVFDRIRDEYVTVQGTSFKIFHDSILLPKTLFKV